jgi:hypothetical protein
MALLRAAARERISPPDVSRTSKNPERNMRPESRETLAEKIKDVFNELVGLPSGNPPDVERERAKERNAPHGTLTAEDAEGLPPHGGTGISSN